MGFYSRDLTGYRMRTSSFCISTDLQICHNHKPWIKNSASYAPGICRVRVSRLASTLSSLLGNFNMLKRFRFLSLQILINYELFINFLQTNSAPAWKNAACLACVAVFNMTKNFKNRTFSHNKNLTVRT